ncbi:MAG: glycosyltransferase family 2 protein, partial [Patescibacteria group bacterium]
MNYPKISTIILNWNGLNDTIECIKSVKAIDYPNYEMIVVDNGSTDNSEKVLREKFPTTTLIQNGDDLGYAEGNNRGIYYALNRGAEYILILNNDTKLEKSCLSELIVVANDNPEMGILGPIAYDYFEQDKLLATNYYFDWNKLKTRSSVMPTS